jgi:TadE-like protein
MNGFRHGMRYHPPIDACRGTARVTRRHQRGAALVEFAIVAPLLLLLILVTIDLSLLLWAHITLQYAVREGARYAVVNHGNLDSSPACGDVIRVIQQNSMGLTDLLKPIYQIAINNGTFQDYPIEPDGSCPVGMFGGRGDLMVLKMTAKWPLFTPYLKGWLHGPHYQFSVAATMQNEAH